MGRVGEVPRVSSRSVAAAVAAAVARLRARVRNTARNSQRKSFQAQTVRAEGSGGAIRGAQSSHGVPTWIRKANRQSSHFSTDRRCVHSPRHRALRQAGAAPFVGAADVDQKDLAPRRQVVRRDRIERGPVEMRPPAVQPDPCARRPGAGGGQSGQHKAAGGTRTGGDSCGHAERPWWRPETRRTRPTSRGTRAARCQGIPARARCTPAQLAVRRWAEMAGVRARSKGQGIDFVKSSVNTIGVRRGPIEQGGDGRLRWGGMIIG